MVSTIKTLPVLLTVVVAVSAVSFSRLIHQEWNTFKLQHNKQYSGKEEEVYRMKVFMDNRYKIARHNQLFQRGEASYSMKMNKYGDLTHHEFTSAMNGFNKSLQSPATKNLRVPILTAINGSMFPPLDVDWRELGAVTPVKEQGHCQACWAFSATGALEGQHFLTTKRLVSLSEQNLIDCSMPFGNSGCEGGTMDNAFQYVKDNRGIDSEHAYPYEALDDICRYDPKSSAAWDSGYQRVGKSEWDLQWAVAFYGPVAAAMDATPEFFKNYEKGVYYDKNCSSKILNHGILVVGYGTDKIQGDYWLVKNSWGAEWGEQGYFRLARNRHNHCGVATDASLPLV